MSNKFQNKYRIPSARLQSWNYAWNGSYFITICTAGRKSFFGEITDGDMQLSPIGEYAQKYWMEIPQHFPFVELEAFVVMPNHVHGIVTINKQGNEYHTDGVNNQTRQCLFSTNQNDIKNTKTESTAGELRFRNPEKNSLSSIVGSYKSIVSKEARKIKPNFAWQARFHDHIIRDYQESVRIHNYITTNIKNWTEDCFLDK